MRTLHKNKTGSSTLTTDYCGNAVYENGVLKMLLNEAGYISFPDKKYHFYLRDHQGNVRIVADKDGNVEETNNYYPFGGTFTSTANVQPYKYNGKELDQKNGLNWYDYGARHYDPAIGRWHVMDPMSEKYYDVASYNYCMNNSVKYIDPTGEDWVVANGSSDYEWRDNITSDSEIPDGFQYIGANDADILKHLGLNYSPSKISTNKIGLVASDAEIGSFAISHMVNVKEQSNITFDTNISYSKEGRIFNGVDINITNISSNSGVDGSLESQSIAEVKYGNKTYTSTLKTPNGPQFLEIGSSVKATTISIPKSALSNNLKVSQIQVTGTWFVATPGGNTPVTIYPGGNFFPIPISFNHTLRFGN